MQNTLLMIAEVLRRKTRTVMVGKVGVGSNEPIRIQSMLTSETTDLDGVIREIRALDQASCEMIRITIPNRKALDAIPEIRRRMSEDGIERPLIADIHFNPQLAVDSCEPFEKVRINPGNYADRKKFEIREYSELQYAEELERIEEVLSIINLVDDNAKQAGSLSHGQKQWLEIGMLLMQDPELLLVDEQHRSRFQPPDNDPAKQDRRRGRTRNAQGQHRQHGAGARGVVRRLRRRDPVDVALAVCLRRAQAVNA